MFRKAPFQWVTILALGFAICQPVKAAVEEGLAAFEQGDYETAYREFKPEAEEGDAVAQSKLGELYYYGKGVPQDYAEAAKWYRLAAEQEIAESQFKLGVMYDLGRVVPQDDREAVKWYSLAAEQGYPWAQYNLGGMYRNGEGVPQDYVQAYIWFNLAVSCGLGAVADKAADKREKIASMMTSEQIAEAKQLTRE